MKTSKTIAVITAALLMGIGASAHAQFVTNESGTAYQVYGNDGPDGLGVGFVFTPTTNVTINALGYFDANGATTGTPTTPVASGPGLSGSPTIDIWSGYSVTGDPGVSGGGSVSRTGTGTLVAQATVPTGNGGTLVGDFLYEAITPVTLTAGTTYAIIGSGGPDAFITAAGSSKTYSDPSITLDGLLYQDVNYNDGDQRFVSGNSNITVGVNFIEATAPEPSTVGMFGLGAIAMLFVIRRFRSASMV